MNPAEFIQSFEMSLAQYPAVAVLVAATAGVLSTTTCPCTLPAGAGLVTYVGSQVEGIADSGHRRHGLVLSIAFFSGVVLSLGALGTVAAIIGRVLAQWGAAFAAGTAVVTLLAGAAALFGPALRRRVPDPDVRRHGGVAGSFLYGSVYSIATITTSAGPLLLLLTIAAAIGRPAVGAVVAIAYAVGRGLPFLFLGVFAGRLGTVIARAERYRRPAEIVSGIVLLGLSAYFVWLSLTLS